jgi:hypothetical protein
METRCCRLVFAISAFELAHLKAETPSSWALARGVATCFVADARWPSLEEATPIPSFKLSPNCVR